MKKKGSNNMHGVSKKSLAINIFHKKVYIPIPTLIDDLSFKAAYKDVRYVSLHKVAYIM
jgi:hypothetical protein